MGILDTLYCMVYLQAIAFPFARYLIASLQKRNSAPKSFSFLPLNTENKVILDLSPVKGHKKSVTTAGKGENWYSAQFSTVFEW